MRKNRLVPDDARLLASIVSGLNYCTHSELHHARSTGIYSARVSGVHGCALRQGKQSFLPAEHFD